MDGEAIDKAEDRAEPAAIIAVIFGASEFPFADRLTASPAFAGSASAFAGYLKSEQGFRLADAQILDLFDNESNVIDQNDRLIEHLNCNQAASDLIIYYVGHGGFLPDREYFLALRSTKRGAEGITGLRIRALAHSLEEHFPGKRVFLILDCCFAGEAVAQFQGDEIGTIVEDKTFDALPSSGTSLLVAASRDEPAIAPAGAAYTMFSDCFLAALGQGLADGRQKLSLADIGELVQKLVRSKFGQRGVRPEIHSPRQTGGDVAKTPLFPNPAYVPPKPRQLPVEIQQALQNPIADIRQGAIRPLAQYLSAGDGALAELARAALEHLASQDDSRSVQKRAREALEIGPVSADRVAAPSVIEQAPPPGNVTPAAPAKAKASRGPWTMVAGITLFLFTAALVWGFIYQGGGERQVSGVTDTKIQKPPADAGDGDREEAPKSPESQPNDRSERIDALLASAGRSFEQDRLDLPPGNNAVADYQAVLALEPGNQAAQAGLERVFQRNLTLAEDALAASALDQAAQYLAKAQTLQPGSDAVAKSRQRIAQARAAIEERGTIERLLSEAEDDLLNDRLTSPANSNAVQRYRAVLDRDAGNAAALAGLERVVARYRVLADNAIKGGNFDKADTYLARAESVGLTDPDLAKMRGRLERERRAAEQDKKIESLLANAERSLAGNNLDEAATYLAKAEQIDAGNVALVALHAKLDKARATPAPLTFAVFPFESLANCHYSVRDEVLDAADAAMRGQARASMEYSYYAEGSDASRIPRARTLWSNNAARRVPMTDSVRTAARKLGVNGVLMVWFECSQSQYVSTDKYKVDVYLIDVDGDEIFHTKENFLDTKRAISDLFHRFFVAHGLTSG